MHSVRESACSAFGVWESETVTGVCCVWPWLSWPLWTWHGHLVVQGAESRSLMCSFGLGKMCVCVGIPWSSADYC